MGAAHRPAPAACDGIDAALKEVAPPVDTF
jgi:hypothetical protein